MLDDRLLLDLDDCAWSDIGGHAREKRIEKGGGRVRLLELSDGYEHPDWCEKPHLGFVLQGRIDLEFDDERWEIAAGNGLEVGAGSAFRHRPIAAETPALLLLIEPADAEA
jgi:quercetin dioxygenase-like cupin family protein